MGQNLVKFLAVKKQPAKLLVKKWLIEMHPVLAVCTAAL